MNSYNKIIDFLPNGTQLMVAVKPPDNLNPEYFKLLSANLSTNHHYKTVTWAAPLVLEEPLKIRFSISSQWNIQRELTKCRCTTPILPNKDFESINSAYQSISEIVEPHRSSRGGTVYKNVFFQADNNTWLSLEIKRDELYEPYRQDYEAKVSIHNDRTRLYVKPLATREEFLKELLEQKDKILEALQAENQDRLLQIQKLNELFKQSKLALYKEKIKELEQRLQQDYPETSGNDSWQTWIYKNHWLFATQYAAPLPKKKVGFHSVPDFIFPTLDGFIDILEIKRPSFQILEKDKSHHGSYKRSRESNEAIGQVINYLHEIELHQLEIAKKIEQINKISISGIKPRGIILIGQSHTWSREKHEALRKLNHSLHCIEITSYTDLLSRGQSLIQMYGDSA